MRHLTRRNLMVLSAGASVVAVAAGAGLSTVSSSDLARATLRRLAGPFKMAEADFQAFFRDFLSAAGAPGGLKAGALRVAEATPVGPKLLAAVTGSSDSLEAFERALLTSFVTQTTYLQATSPETPLTYLGDNAACSSPFADLTIA